MNASSVVRIAHIAVGALAFLVMAVPLIAAKGGRLHRRFGAVFAWAMAANAVTAVPLVAVRVVANPRTGLFFAQILLLAIMSLVFGIRALKAKVPGRRFVLERGAAAVALVVSIAAFAFAAWLGNGVFAFFGALTALLAFRWLRFFIAPQRDRLDWFLMHMLGMCTLAITAVTAFTVTNAGLLGVPHDLRWIAWVAPGALGGVAIGFWQRKYRARLPTPALG